MANRTAWTAGILNAGLGWTSLFSSSDLNSLTSGNTVRSSIADITNGTSLDMFMDVAFRCVINQSTTLTVGSSCALYLFPLLDDSATYGDNSIPTAGASGQVTSPPGLAPAAVFPFRSGLNSITLLAGFAQQVIIPPGSFRGAIGNFSGFTLTGAANACAFRSYNINLNS